MIIYNVYDADSGTTLLEAATDAELSRWYDSNPHFRQTELTVDEMTDGSEIHNLTGREIG